MTSLESTPPSETLPQKKTLKWWDKFKESCKNIFLTNREIDVESKVAIEEKLADGRIVLSNGEIIKDGQLWGYRVYKGFNAWDLKQGRPNTFFSEADYIENYQDVLNRVQRGEVRNVPLSVENAFKLSDLSDQEKLAVSQMFGSGIGGSWSRDPIVAIGFSRGEAKENVAPVVVQKDVPKDHAVSVEAVVHKVPSIREHVQDYITEKEITIFEFVTAEKVDKIYRVEEAESNFAYRKLKKRKKQDELYYSYKSDK